MRPDELANQALIERDMAKRKNIMRGASTLGGLAVTGLGGGKALAGLASNVAPFLSQYLTPDIAMKGLKKVAPQLGEFLERGVKAGLNVEDGLNYIKESLQPKEEAEIGQKNIIEQYSPDLFQFIQSKISEGMTPLQAAALAQMPGKSSFANVIKKIEKDHKTPWSNIVQTVFGNESNAAQPQPAQQQAPDTQGLASFGKGIGGAISDNFYNQAFDALTKGSTVMAGVNDPFLQFAKPAFDAGQIKSPQDLKALANQYKNSRNQQQPQGMGPGAQSLMAMLQKINQRLGA